jgi:hypothetical protein
MLSKMSFRGYRTTPPDIWMMGGYTRRKKIASVMYLKERI